MTVIEEPDYTHISSGLYTAVLRRLRFKRVWSSLELTKEFVRESGRLNAEPYQLRLKLRSTAEEQRCGDMQVFRLAKKPPRESAPARTGAASKPAPAAEPAAGPAPAAAAPESAAEPAPAATAPRTPVVIYLHGGGWVRPITDYHWFFVDNLCADNNVPVYLPLYPEYPNAGSMETLRALRNLYKQVTEAEPGRPMVLMGDSAGAELCLVLTQIIQQENLPDPAQLILLSAPCDTEDFGPAERLIEETDPMLSLVGVEYTYAQWSADFAWEGISLNPLRADLRLPLKILHIIGSNDMLYPGALRFDEKAMAAGLDIETRVFRDMFHVFPLMPVFQAHRARNLIRDRLRRLEG